MFLFLLATVFLDSYKLANHRWAERSFLYFGVVALSEHLIARYLPRGYIMLALVAPVTESQIGFVICIRSGKVGFRWTRPSTALRPGSRS